MTRRSGVLLLLLLLAACQGQGGGQQQAAPTTTVEPTTTRPDPAEAACKVLEDDWEAAVDQMAISRDERIVEAVKDFRKALAEDNPFDGELGGLPATEIQELVDACRAAGYL
jgi:hypothetical protein